jgi:hypothetical protein
MLSETTGKSPFGPHPDDLAELSPSESGRFSHIRAIAFASTTIRSDRVVAVTLSCTGGHRRAISVESETPGFDVELLPERSQRRGQVIVAIRVHRRLGTIRLRCRLRFCIGDACGVASITVVP